MLFGRHRDSASCFESTVLNIERPLQIFSLLIFTWTDLTLI